MSVRIKQISQQVGGDSPKKWTSSQTRCVGADAVSEVASAPGDTGPEAKVVANEIDHMSFKRALPS